MTHEIEVDGDLIRIHPDTLEQIIGKMNPTAQQVLRDLPTAALRVKQLEIWMEAGSLELERRRSG